MSSLREGLEDQGGSERVLVRKAVSGDAYGYSIFCRRETLMPNLAAADGRRLVGRLPLWHTRQDTISALV